MILAYALAAMLLGDVIAAVEKIIYRHKKRRRRREND